MSCAVPVKSGLQERKKELRDRSFLKKKGGGGYKRIVVASEWAQGVETLERKDPLHTLRGGGPRLGPRSRRRVPWPLAWARVQ